jgi:hypothetical protein
MNKSEKIVSTKSLWLSAYLLLRGHELVTFELITPSTGYFLFEKDPDIERDISEYYGIETVVEVPLKKYLESYNALRDLLMNKKREAKREEQRWTSTIKTRDHLGRRSI